MREIAGVPMGSYIEWMASCWLVSLLGCPAVSVPFGRTEDDLPVGLQLVGPSVGGLARRPGAPPVRLRVRAGRRAPRRFPPR